MPPLRALLTVCATLSGAEPMIHHLHFFPSIPRSLKIDGLVLKDLGQHPHRVAPGVRYQVGSRRAGGGLRHGEWSELLEGDRRSLESYGIYWL